MRNSTSSRRIKPRECSGGEEFWVAMHLPIQHNSDNCLERKLNFIKGDNFFGKQYVIF